MPGRRPSLAALVRQVTEHPDEVLTGRSPAVEQLAARGARAVGLVLRAMRGPIPPGQHPRDVIEALAAVLHAIARGDPGPLIDVLRRDEEPADPHLVMLTWALAAAPADRVLDALAGALRHRNPWVRWSAVEALVRLRTRKVAPLLVEALRDRSAMVKFVAVEALRRRRSLRSAEAIDPLRRIIEQADRKALPWSVAVLPRAADGTRDRRHSESEEGPGRLRPRQPTLFPCEYPREAVCRGNWPPNLL
jgi:hypothetical protein